MTLPHERTNAVINVRSFLLRLATPYGGGIKRVPRAVRAEARRLMRHYPCTPDLGEAGRACPSVFDEETARKSYVQLDYSEGSRQA